MKKQAQSESLCGSQDLGTRQTGWATRSLSDLHTPHNAQEMHNPALAGLAQ